MRSIPVGMVQFDELHNILSGLALTGGVDVRTLAIVAQTVGFGPEFINWLKREGTTPLISISTQKQLAQLEEA